MALIKCKECGKEISSKAKTCPSCGAKVPKKTSLFTWLVLILILLFVYSSYDTPSTPRRTINEDKDSGKSEAVIKQRSKPEATAQVSLWRTNTSSDEMTGKLKAFAHSPIVSPEKRMSFPYHDVNSWMGVGCDNDNEWVYVGFNHSPNISNDENQDGYSIIKTRLKWDEEIESIVLTQDWGAKFLNFKNDAQVITRIETSETVMLELKWHGEQSIHFEYPLTGSKKAISHIRNLCKS